ncbi:class III extradiol dioxygenase subunit B-like domain-containing protein [Micromonospora sp. WMMD812]|uniref:class III extradiol dioxygenase subunit B-like domain-containing protein n=1 Tax=Micromonospora sp. WMMD812 TaxID=3015152 RepID=UPI00248B2ADA|nr:class III extradiol dioxygenase subunit B-like domain-containing protein [Micromonospora sp. WMMD812]WBB70296.1 class III extradiol dioxygenase subunit B-like domain-containing protein [Micromonospora sp. WMMD812]
MTGSARRRTGDSRYGERVPLVAAAVCPHPPLLVPEVAGAAAPELDDLRAACDAAVARLFAHEPDAVVLVGDGPATGWIRPPATGSLQPWGVDLAVPLDSEQPDRGAVLPLSLTVGAWLLARHEERLPVAAVQVAAAADAPTLRALAGQVHDHRPRVALLVLGDGSACRGERSPGYADPRAEPYDEGVATALAGADAEALLGLDPVLSAELKVAGRAPWQVLAGAARATGGDWRGELLSDTAPYGVAYLVATWEPA